MRLVSWLRDPFSSLIVIVPSVASTLMLAACINTATGSMDVSLNAFGLGVRLCGAAFLFVAGCCFVGMLGVRDRVFSEAKKAPELELAVLDMFEKARSRVEAMFWCGVFLGVVGLGCTVFSSSDSYLKQEKSHVVDYIKDVKRDVDTLLRGIPIADRKLDEVSHMLKELSASVVTSGDVRDAKLDDLTREIGFLAESIACLESTSDSVRKSVEELGRQRRPDNHPDKGGGVAPQSGSQ